MQYIELMEVENEAIHYDINYVEAFRSKLLQGEDIYFRILATGLSNRPNFHKTIDWTWEIFIFVIDYQLNSVFIVF